VLDRVEQLIAFGGRRDRAPLEIIGEADVGEELVAVGVEVEEGAGLAGEVSSAAFPQSLHRSELGQQGLESIEVGCGRVSHAGDGSARWLFGRD
jgi:hypothetical protein